tara:strand:+ start:602 stop:868 length:267 start_codon:yes stop_codon:yes gene_type:complete
MEDWISVGDNDIEYQNEINNDHDILNMVNGYNNEIEELDSTIVNNENDNKKVFYNQTTESNYDVYIHLKIVLFHLKEFFLDFKKKFCL